MTLEQLCYDYYTMWLGDKLIAVHDNMEIRADASVVAELFIEDATSQALGDESDIMAEAQILSESINEKLNNNTYNKIVRKDNVIPFNKNFGRHV
jgi:hypothetical protein